jgi:hypothetical protein
MIRRLLLAALLAAGTSSSRAADTPPTAEPSLIQMATDGIRACMSIAQGRAPAEAAAIFGLTAAEGLFVRETVEGKVEIMPPAGERTTCRTQIYALTLDPTVMWESIRDFLTTPPQAYAPLQSRIAESLGSYASRTSIWVASGGANKGVAMVTLYEIISHEYYHGPKILIDFLISKR